MERVQIQTGVVSTVIGAVLKRVEVYVDVLGKGNIIALSNCGYYSVNAALFRVSLRMPG